MSHFLRSYYCYHLIRVHNNAPLHHMYWDIEAAVEHDTAHSMQCIIAIAQKQLLNRLNTRLGGPSSECIKIHKVVLNAKRVMFRSHDRFHDEKRLNISLRISE